MPNLSYNFAGQGAINATSIVATGTITGDKFRAADKTAVDTAYGFTSAAGFGLFAAANKLELAAGNASQLEVSNGFIDGNSGAALRPNALFTLGNPTAVALTAAQNNYAGPSGGNLSPIWRLTPDAARTITGIVAMANGTALFVLNVETTVGRNITLTNEDVASTAANRFVTPSALGLVVPPGGGALLIYNATLSRWNAYPLF